jgi:hypothetical protein
MGGTPAEYRILHWRPVVNAPDIERVKELTRRLDEIAGKHATFVRKS